MGGADLEAGKTVERALEDQVGERERRLERVADGVFQPAVAAQAALQLGRALRMDEDQHAELLGPGPEGMELRVRQLRAVHAAADAGAAQAELPDAVLELLHGEIRELQRDRSEGDEALGLGCADLGQLFILDADQLCGFANDLSAFRHLLLLAGWLTRISHE